MEKYFKNKSIAVVGNSIAILDREYGKLIDNCDIVCRINEGCVNIPNTAGTKTTYNFINSAKRIKRVWPHKNPVNLTIISKTWAFDDSIPYLPDYNTEEIESMFEKPSAGIHILNFLSYCNCKSVSIFGFDGFKHKSFYNNRISPHDGDKEMDFINNLIKNNSNWILIK